MMRSIIDMPRVFLRASALSWAIDWRSQSAGDDVAGGSQIVGTGFPRFVGDLPLTLPREMLGAFRALMLSVQGRRNALRVPMIDPLTLQLGGAPWAEQWAAYRAGTYVEGRPKVEAVTAASAGDSTVVVDERPLRQPIPLGAILSYGDWPFVVQAKSGPIEARVLTVARLVVDIPAGGEIDLAARGVFTLDNDLAGQPSYALSGASGVSMSLTEWITR